MLGACLRDNSICFWEERDGFRFERRIESHLENFQYKIWHIEHRNIWVTTDKSYKLYSWRTKSDFPKQFDHHFHNPA